MSIGAVLASIFNSPDISAAFQQEFQQNGIRYDFITGTTLIVRGPADTKTFDELVIPAKITLTAEHSDISSPGTYDVTVIGRNAFEGCRINKLTIPSSIKEIFPFAFLNAEIGSVTLNIGLRAIHQGAFYNVKKLKRVELPENLVSLSSLSFAAIPTLEYVSIPKKFGTVVNTAFIGCSNISVVEMRSPVSYDVSILPREVFGANCQEITFVVPDGATGSYTADDAWSGLNITELASINTLECDKTIKVQPYADGLIVEPVGTPRFVVICDTNGRVMFRDTISDTTAIPLPAAIYVVTCGNKCIKIASGFSPFP